MLLCSTYHSFFQIIYRTDNLRVILGKQGVLQVSLLLTTLGTKTTSSCLYSTTGTLQIAADSKVVDVLVEVVIVVEAAVIVIVSVVVSVVDDVEEVLDACQQRQCYN
ncbi:hypothetical protein DPMN_067940 [Dreissena polymorpha]|uniref:Uncharacterized protein n=1 Tax=Dreissena polymorpha TaxID=45954 RepID=A0A9D3YW69_DREPO|nr:hypothetical protein DPMN_067940 [Dreissena polymorpha]